MRQPPDYDNVQLPVRIVIDLCAGRVPALLYQAPAPSQRGTQEQIMTHRGSRLLAMFVLAIAAGAMLAAPFDAEARRMGGGKSFGRQSSNITQQRQAVTPPAASTTPRTAAPAAGAATAGAAKAATARSGMSRWLGPIA